MKKFLAAALLAVLTLSLSGCGNNDAEASKAISDQLIKQQKKSGSASQFFSLDRKDADCIGDGFVDKIGTENLQKYGVITKDNKAKDGVNNVKMSAKDAKSATSTLFDCTDVEKMMRAAINKAGNIPSSMQSCVNKVLSEDNLRPLFTGVFQGKSSEAQQQLAEPLQKCATQSAG